MTRKAPKMDERQYERVVAAREYINGVRMTANQARILEYIAFMELFEGKKLTVNEAKTHLGIKELY